MQKLFLVGVLALSACAGSSLDERAYLGMNAGYQFGADTIAIVAPNFSAEDRARIDAQRMVAFRAVCRARLAYNLANPQLARPSTPRCAEALGPNPQVTGYDEEILAAGELLRRYVEQLVALAARQLGHVLDGEHE